MGQLIEILVYDYNYACVNINWIWKISITHVWGTNQNSAFQEDEKLLMSTKDSLFYMIT